ncbi:hypothetical protein FRB99_005720 [Tulasnella sp. 403]|nr:hypothetical protein FRB99_005720 [Tulasnella sp. 403]
MRATTLVQLLLLSSSAFATPLLLSTKNVQDTPLELVPHLQRRTIISGAEVDAALARLTTAFDGKGQIEEGALMYLSEVANKWSWFRGTENSRAIKQAAQGLKDYKVQVENLAKVGTNEDKTWARGALKQINSHQKGGIPWGYVATGVGGAAVGGLATKEYLESKQPPTATEPEGDSDSTSTIGDVETDNTDASDLD